MGIPSYFSYIIKNYSNIIRDLLSLERDKVVFHNLFMDCNSIIYDVVRDIEQDPEEVKHFAKSEHNDRFESRIIELTIQKICEHIDYIDPKCLVYIAFDGVAPFAKMEQQRIRRNKGVFLSKTSQYIEHYDGNPTNDEQSMHWSTSNITPGTKFMQKLSDTVLQYFDNKKYVSKHPIQIIVSTSNDPGEGEHKMFQYIRDYASTKVNVKDMQEQNTIVYGLDSDLIMLSIFHCMFFKNIYIFRETPAFMSSLVDVAVLNPSNKCYFMDISTLSRSILSEMQINSVEAYRLYDYVFLCFFLGNDFLPHFPSLNIRTNGFSILLSVYRELIGKYPNRSFVTEDMQIQWKWVHLFIQYLAKYEHDYLIAEYDLRNKWRSRKWQSTSAKERDFVFQSIPVIYRQEEDYICPQEKHWEKRYYLALFHDTVHVGSTNNISEICVNYLEGLEWTFKYYTTNCPDWKWKYKYHYAPLLTDLCNYIPKTVHHFIPNNKVHQPFLPIVQLAYVLPRSQHHLLSDTMRVFLHDHHKELYPDTCEFQWAFCRYFWEAHAMLPSISIDVLNEWNVKCSRF